MGYGPLSRLDSGLSSTVRREVSSKDIADLDHVLVVRSRQLEELVRLRAQSIAFFQLNVL